MTFFDSYEYKNPISVATSSQLRTLFKKKIYVCGYELKSTETTSPVSQTGKMNWTLFVHKKFIYTQMFKTANTNSQSWDYLCLWQQSCTS